VSVSNPQLDGKAAKEGLSYVAPGEHVLTADDQGGKAIRKLVPVKAGEIVSVTLSHEEEKKPKVIVVEKAVPVPTKPLSPWFVVGGGVLTAGGVAATIYLGLQTLDKKQAFLDGGSHDQDLFDAANRAQLETNIALGATIGVAVITTAVALFFTDWHGSKKETF
jgi:hypothetical protein